MTTEIVDNGAPADGANVQDTVKTDGQQDANQQNVDQPTGYKNWFASQTPEVQEMITGEHDGLYKALQSERDARKGLEKDMRSVADKLEGEHQQELRTMADNLAALEIKATFFEEAVRSGITNPTLAYAAAVQNNMFDRRGLVDFEEMKKLFPELFSTGVVRRVGAGAGGDNGVPEKVTMDQLIRKKANR